MTWCESIRSSAQSQGGISDVGRWVLGNILRRGKINGDEVLVRIVQITTRHLLSVLSLLAKFSAVSALLDYDSCVKYLCTSLCWLLFEQNGNKLFVTNIGAIM